MEKSGRRTVKLQLHPYKKNVILYLFRTKLAHARGFRDFLNYLGICSLKKFNTIKIIPRGVTLLRLYYYFQISLTCDYLGRNEPHLQISPQKNMTFHFEL